MIAVVTDHMYYVTALEAAPHPGVQLLTTARPAETALEMPMPMVLYSPGVNQTYTHIPS